MKKKKKKISKIQRRKRKNAINNLNMSIGEESIKKESSVNSTSVILDHTTRCNFCGKPLDNKTDNVINTNTMTDKRNIAHFNCTIDRIKEKEDLKQGQGVLYVGGGYFALVEYKDDQKISFRVIKKIKA